MESSNAFKQPQSSLMIGRGKPNESSGLPRTLLYQNNVKGSQTAAMYMDIGSDASSVSSLNLEQWDNASAASEDQRPATKKRRTHHLTLGVKLKIISELEGGVKRKLVQQKYKLASSTLSTLIANKEDLKKAIGNSDYCLQRHRIRQPKYGDLEAPLWDWCKEQINLFPDKPITNLMISSKALELAAGVGLSGFKATNGWICRFRQRRGISKSPVAKLAKIKVTPEADPHLVNKWRNVILPDLMKKFDPNDIFIAHETAFFYRLTPDKMLPYLGERCTGGKLARERLTVLFVCNMTGTEKLPLLVVGQNGRPTSLKHAQTLPTQYFSNKKVWLLPVFFEAWLKKFDNEMEESWRRVALFVSPSENHTHVENLNSVTLVFLPPDKQFQPGSQGIDRELKMNYRQIVLKKYLDKMEEFGPYGRLSVTVLDALLWLREAWGAVTPDCISQAFRKAEFSSSLSLGASCESASSQHTAAMEDYRAAFEKLETLIALDPSVTPESYLALDSHLVTFGSMSSCEMMMARAEALEPDGDQEEANDPDGVPEEMPSITDAKHCLSTLFRFFEHFNGEGDSFKYISDMENYIYKTTNQNASVKQTTILDFFPKRANRKSKTSKPSRSYFFPRS